MGEGVSTGAERFSAFVEFLPGTFARGAGTPAECVVCSERTNWFHRNLALYFCSKDCFGRFQAERQHELDGTWRLVESLRGFHHAGFLSRPAITGGRALNETAPLEHDPADRPGGSRVRSPHDGTGAEVGGEG